MEFEEGSWLRRHLAGDGAFGAVAEGIAAAHLEAQLQDVEVEFDEHI